MGSMMIDGKPVDFEVDFIGEEGRRSTWLFCGAFPLANIARGWRACRRGWRLGKGFKADKPAMLSVFMVEIPLNKFDLALDGNRLAYARDTEGERVEISPFSFVEHMLANDWFLEQSKK